MQNCEMNTELSHRIICLRLNLVVPDVAGTANTLSEEKISDKCFELMFAFDEVLQSYLVCRLIGHFCNGSKPQL